MFERIDGMRTIEFGTPGASREKLVNLILHGNKRATAGLLISDYEAEGEPVEHAGELLAIVDNDGKHVGTMKVTRAEILRFADVPDEFALAEAEGVELADSEVVAIGSGISRDDVFEIIICARPTTNKDETEIVAKTFQETLRAS